MLLEHDRSKNEGKAHISLLLSTGRRSNFALWVMGGVRQEGSEVTPRGRCGPPRGQHLAGLRRTLWLEEGVHVKYSRRAATTGGGGAGESDGSRTLRDGIQAALRFSVGKYCPLASADCRDKRTDGFIK